MESRDIVREWLRAPEVRFVVQPLISLTSAQVMGYELLSRPSQGGQDLPVERFFHEAHAENLALAVDQVLIPQILQYLDDIRPEHPVFINLHPATLLDEDIQSLILGRASLAIEVTERAEWATVDVERFLRELHHQGGVFALDDFGSGYSGLEKLVSIRPDYVKLDYRLIHGCDTSTVKQNVISAVSQLANILGFQLLAEGIETESELSICMALGATLGQGYYLARPLPWDEQTKLSEEAHKSILEHHESAIQIRGRHPIFSDWQYHAALLEDLINETHGMTRLDLICRQLYSILKPLSVTCLLADLEGFRPIVSLGHSYRRVMTREHPSVALTAYRENRLQVIQRMDQEDTFSGSHALNNLLGSPQSVAIMPVGNPVWGVIGADFMIPNAWDGDRLSVLKAMARLATLMVSSDELTPREAGVSLKDGGRS